MMSMAAYMYAWVQLGTGPAAMNVLVIRIEKPTHFLRN